MALRSSMGNLIGYVQRLVFDAGATTWTSTLAIQDALDHHATHFDYLPLAHDSDYRRYECKQRLLTARQAAEANVSQLSETVYDVADFGAYRKVGFFDSDWVLRASPTEATAAHSPNWIDLWRGVFVFSTPPNRELYFKGTGYNVWNAAADLLLETPDTGRDYDVARTRGQVSRTIRTKWEEYRQRGLLLNRPKITLTQW